MTISSPGQNEDPEGEGEPGKGNLNRDFGFTLSARQRVMFRFPGLNNNVSPLLFFPLSIVCFFDSSTAGP